MSEEFTISLPPYSEIYPIERLDEFKDKKIILLYVNVKLCFIVNMYGIKKNKNENLKIKLKIKNRFLSRQGLSKQTLFIISLRF